MQNEGWCLSGTRFLREKVTSPIFRRNKGKVPCILKIVFEIVALCGLYKKCKKKDRKFGKEKLQELRNYLAKLGQLVYNEEA